MRRLLKLAGALQGLLLALGICAAASAVFKVLGAHFLGRLVATAVKMDAQQLRRYAIGGLAIMLASWGLAFLRQLVGGLFVHLMLARLRRQVSASLGRAAPSAMSSMHSGDVLSRLSGDTALLEQLFKENLPALIARTLSALLAVLYLLVHDWKLTLLALIPTPLLLVVADRVSRPLKVLGKQAQEAMGRMNVVSREALAEGELVRAAGMQQGFSSRYEGAYSRWLEAGLRQATQTGRLFSVGLALSLMPWIVVFTAGGYMVLSKEMDLGLLFTFLELLGTLAFPLQEMPRLLGEIRSKLTVVSRVLALVDLPSERTGGAVVSLDADPLIEFRDVTFSYPGLERPILANIHLRVRRGQKVALVGSSGSGKSTVLRLLLGDFEPVSGEIFISGRPLGSLDLGSLRQQCAVAGQDVFLFDTTIRENLRTGSLGAADDVLQAAASTASADEFIQALQHQYEATVGEAGGRLSGGQRQQLAIARALVKDAPIVIIDEATSALDPQLEHRLHAEVFARNPRRTLIVVAHRLSTIHDADQIYVFEGGRIVESGGHEELLARGGRYTELYRAQSVSREQAHG